MEVISPMKSHLRPADNELRIVIVTACYFVLDGVTLTIRRLASHLRSRNAAVKVVTTVPKDFDRNQCDEDIIIVPGIDIPFSDAGSGYAFGSGLHESTIREIERFKPTCIHFTVPDFVSLDGIRWCQKNNVPYIATWHSNYSDYLKYYMLEWIFKAPFLWYLRGFYEQIPVVYVPTPYIIGKMKDEGFGKHTRLVEWGRGIDLKLFAPERRSQSFRASKGISPTDIVILWVGRIVPEKQPDVWLEVMERLSAEGLPAKGLVVGHGNYEATLAKLPNVSCCGWLSGTSLAEAYASADILLFPSAVETFGNVTLEALASGCVCVVEELCGKHLVENNHNGYLCPAGDREAFYQATKTLVMDSEKRRVMGINARESSKKFDRNLILQQMAEYYKDAYVRHNDPTYMHNLLQKPEVAGNNIVAVCCCHYYFVKILAAPFLNTTSAAQNLASASSQCIKQSRSKLNFGDYIYSNSVEMPREDTRLEEGAQTPVNSRGKRIASNSFWTLVWARIIRICQGLNDWCNGNVSSKGENSDTDIQNLASTVVLKVADFTATGLSYVIVVLLIAATFIV